MEEDLEFNRMVKASLEASAPFRFVPPKARRRGGALRWAVPALMAASFAVAAVFHAILAPQSDLVANAISLLSEVDGIDLDTETGSSAELLLAWQDAPCQELL